MPGRGDMQCAGLASHLTDRKPANMRKDKSRNVHSRKAQTVQEPNADRIRERSRESLRTMATGSPFRGDKSARASSLLLTHILSPKVKNKSESLALLSMDGSVGIMTWLPSRRSRIYGRTSDSAHAGVACVQNEYWGLFPRR